MFSGNRERGLPVDPTPLTSKSFRNLTLGPRKKDRVWGGLRGPVRVPFHHWSEYPVQCREVQTYKGRFGVPDPGRDLFFVESKFRLSEKTPDPWSLFSPSGSKIVPLGVRPNPLRFPSRTSSPPRFRTSGPSCVLFRTGLLLGPEPRQPHIDPCNVPSPWGSAQ